MSTKYESAKLILELYELRREETMRKARNWFFTFNPDTFEDIRAAAMNPESSAYYRMVTSYWDMACSFVANGAIDEQMFADANAEHVVVFAKIQPFLDEIRGAYGSPNYAKHLEEVVMNMPDAATRIPATRERIRKMAEAAAAAAAQVG